LNRKPFPRPAHQAKDEAVSDEIRWLHGIIDGGKGDVPEADG
jgi:hypothetical protein